MAKWPEHVGADEASLAAAFHGVLPETYDDPIVGPVLRRLEKEDPDIIAAVADVDRSLIWLALDEDPLMRLHRAFSMARFAARVQRAD